MTTAAKAALFEIVRAALANHTGKFVEDVIYDCHNGRLDGYIVTQDNLHLFRQYRNNVSGDPREMINDALEAA